MAEVPALFNDLRQLMRYETKKQSKVISLRSRILAFRSLLSGPKNRLSSGLLDPEVVEMIPNELGERHPAELAILFRFPSPDVAKRYLLYWSNVIISCQMMRHIRTLLTNKGDFHSEWTETSYYLEAREAADRIYACVHHMRDHKPFGGFPMTYAFSTAFSVAQQTLEPDRLKERRVWILSSVEMLLGACSITAKSFALDVLAEYLSGGAALQ